MTLNQKIKRKIIMTPFIPKQGVLAAPVAEAAAKAKAAAAATKAAAAFWVN
tara:strand:+ start:65 stop:217 length:153 start_codon:yes stop_codon:yes gene_type:complete